MLQKLCFFFLIPFLFLEMQITGVKISRHKSGSVYKFLPVYKPTKNCLGLCISRGLEIGFLQYLISCWFQCVNIFYIRFRFCETFTVVNSVARILLIEILYKFRTIKCWFTPYLNMYVLGYCKFKCFVYPV